LSPLDYNKIGNSDWDTSASYLPHKEKSNKPKPFNTHPQTKGQVVFLDTSMKTFIGSDYYAALPHGAVLSVATISVVATLQPYPSIRPVPPIVSKGKP